MIFNNIRSPGTFAFKPGRLLWVFVVFFLPLFFSLGVWQLNRAQEKEQLISESTGPLLSMDAIDWRAPPLYRDVHLSGDIESDVVILLDNKTHNGQFGYEVFVPVNTGEHRFLVSLGWVNGSSDRRQLPTLLIPPKLSAVETTIRHAPTNPLFGVESNLQHETNNQVWIVQSLSLPWLQNVFEHSFSGFLQLKTTEIDGVGPQVWQPTVMSPAKHRGYALQWFSMAVALLGMFLYAGFKRQK